MREDKSRIGFDVPKELKEELLTYTVPGTLSEILRTLLIEFLVLVKDIGIKDALQAIHSKKLTLTVKEK